MTINEIHAYYALFSAKKHMAGFDMMRMLYFSAYDMEVHIRYVIKLLYQRWIIKHKYLFTIMF